MIQKTVKAYTTNTLKSLSRKCKTLNHLKQVHAHLLKSPHPQNPLAIGHLLSAAAATAASFPYACSIFQTLLIRNTFMYNTMIRGYVHAHSPVPAILFYLDMIDSGLAANNFTFPPLIKACSSLLPNYSKKIGRVVHGHVIKLGFLYDRFVGSALVEFYSMNLEMGIARMVFDKMPDRDVVLWTAMVDGYGKVGDVENARAVFDEMPERNVISWSAMMAAYSQVSDFRQVLSLFRQMQEVGIKPNESVLVSALTACAHLGALAQGLWIHSYAKRHNLESNPILATALVDMYSKCGGVESALSVFEGIPNKDAGAWNAIISGASMNGDARKLLKLFDKMITAGTQPTETTFVALLTVCTHARLVQEGLKLFKQMDTYGVKRKFEHYACVVDLLARAGMLKEAEKFIEEEIGGIEKADANVWGALLGACRTYGNVEIGNRVWKKLASMGVSDCGVHVLSYNIFREAGWELEAKRVRRFILEEGMKKKPGCSVIEVNGVVEEFLAGDLSHTQSQQMCELLDSLSNMLYPVG
ncbi:pentatricopeptide repeat-containing protein At5g48910-like [Actinidia eriantha]|uniref:pentatricopeptide repeat-containing protein At5g48910-like n=1 Tax=Actinidia eriantha TaxID=165200 RepID=UPI00258E15FA|nr:pentatricopeptide repeat-containing protein At5g48910-like [Actinidia eriantha]